jgi:hypothetical protein
LRRLGPRMPRFRFHLHAGEGRANADNSGQHLPDRDAAREMARWIAGRLVAWNLEPVSWLDYQVQVTDEAGAIVFELPLAQAVGQSWDDRLRAETAGADADLENESLSNGPWTLEQDTSPSPGSTQVVRGSGVQSHEPGARGRTASRIPGPRGATQAHASGRERANPSGIAPDLDHAIDPQASHRPPVAAQPCTRSDRAEEQPSTHRHAGAAKRSFWRLFRPDQSAWA